MGNYEQLKEAIAEVIKTNGNEEITGIVMQNALKTIISSIGVNETFAGIAKPNTSPGTPDANIFYIADTPGNYVNFNNIEIKKLSIIRNNTGNWVAESLNIQSYNAYLSENCVVMIAISLYPSFKSDGTVTFSSNNAFSADRYINFSFADGTSINFNPSAETNTYKLGIEQKLLFNWATNEIRVIGYTEPTLDTEVLLLKRGQISAKFPLTYMNGIKGYTGGKLLPYVGLGIFENGYPWTCVSPGKIQTKRLSDGFSIKLFVGNHYFYKYDGSLVQGNISSETTYTLPNYGKFVFDTLSGQYSVLTEYDQLLPHQILLLRAAITNASDTYFGFTAGLWLPKILSIRDNAEKFKAVQSFSNEFSAFVNGNVDLSIRGVGANMAITFTNGIITKQWVPTSDNKAYTIPKNGFLVWDYIDNKMRVVATNNYLNPSDVVVLARGNSTYTDGGKISGFGGYMSVIDSYIGGVLFPNLIQSIFDKCIEWECVSTATVVAKSDGNVNVGSGYHLFYRLNGSYLYYTVNNQEFNVPPYGKLVYNCCDNAVSVLTEYEPFTQFDVLLLKRGAETGTKDAINTFVGGLWYKKLLSKPVDFSPLYDAIDNLETQINDIEEQIQNISVYVGFADLPVSDGSDIQVGYAYINSSDNTIKVKR